MLRIIARLEQIGIIIAIVVTALIMVLVSADAVLRYSVNAPLRWVFEIVTYYLMVAAIYCSLSATFTSGDHVNISLLRDILPTPVRNASDIVWVLMSAVVFAFAAWGTGVNTYEAWHNNEFIPGYFLWPSWLSHLPIPLGLSLIVLRLVHHAFTLLVDGQDPSVESHGEPVE